MPGPDRVKFGCITCQIATWHEIASSVQPDGDSDEEFREEYQIVRCRGCESLSFRQVFTEIEDNAELGETLWPPRERARPNLAGWFQLPKGVRRIYSETNKAMSGVQPVLAAVGIRAIIEAVCKQKKAKGRTLQQRINALAIRGVLTKAQARELHQTRFLGNKAAHEASPADPKVLASAMTIAEHMLTSVYLLSKIARPMRHRRIKRA